MRLYPRAIWQLIVLAWDERRSPGRTVRRWVARSEAGA